MALYGCLRYHLIANEKQDVNGTERSDLYKYLIHSEVGAGARVNWNFEKFLVNRKGEVVQRYGSRTTPADPTLVQAIDAALEAK